MSQITLPFVFSVGNTIISSQVNSVNTTIYNDYNGNITDINISPTAAIGYTKLALNGTIKQSDILSTFNNNSGFGLVPSGGIIMWSGSIASIPTGWFLCNGSNSTPDLRNRFIVCADADSTGIAMSTVTGSALQTSDGQIPEHTHPTGEAIYQTGGTEALNNISGNASTGSFGTGTKNVAVFFALAYIMKS